MCLVYQPPPLAPSHTNNTSHTLQGMQQSTSASSSFSSLQQGPPAGYPQRTSSSPRVTQQMYSQAPPSPPPGPLASGGGPALGQQFFEYIEVMHYKLYTKVAKAVCIATDFASVLSVSLMSVSQCTLFHCVPASSFWGVSYYSVVESQKPRGTLFCLQMHLWVVFLRVTTAEWMCMACTTSALLNLKQNASPARLLST